VEIGGGLGEHAGGTGTRGSPSSRERPSGDGAGGKRRLGQPRSLRSVANSRVITDSPTEGIGVVAHTRGGRRCRSVWSWETRNGRDWGNPTGGLRIEPEGRLVGSGSMVEVAGAVGGLANVGLVGRKREGGDRAAVTATSVRGDPRRTVLQSINVLLSERGTLLIDLTHGRPGIIEFVGRCEVAADGHEGPNKSGEDNNTEEGERGRVGNRSHKEARNIGTSEDTCRA
jgi:hypothetical protein